MLIQIPDFDKVETGFEALPAAEYEAIVTKCASGKSRQKQTPQIEWEYTIQGPTHSGRRLFINSFLSANAVFTTKRLVVGCGAPFTPDGFATEDCLGKRVKLVVGQKANTLDTSRIDNVIDKITPIA